MYHRMMSRGFVLWGTVGSITTSQAPPWPALLRLQSQCMTRSDAKLTPGSLHWRTAGSVPASWAPLGGASALCLLGMLLLLAVASMVALISGTLPLVSQVLCDHETKLIYDACVPCRPCMFLVEAINDQGHCTSQHFMASACWVSDLCFLYKSQVIKISAYFQGTLSSVWNTFPVLSVIPRSAWASTSLSAPRVCYIHRVNSDQPHVLSVVPQIFEWFSRVFSGKSLKVDSMSRSIRWFVRVCS